MSKLSSTKKNIEKVARLIANQNGLFDYSITVILSRSENVKSRPSYDKIRQVVCEYMDVDKEIVFMHHRIQPFCLARQIIWYLAYRIWGYECTGLANISGFDHSTVLHGAKVTKEQMEVDGKFLAQIKQLIDYLNN